MNPLPHQDFEVIVGESLTEVHELLSAEVGPKNFWGAFSRKKAPSFNGVIDEKSFTICKNVFKNEFVPVLYGSLEPHHTGTRIHVKMRLQPLISSVLLTGLACVIVFLLFPPETLSVEAMRIILMVSGMIILMTYVGFYFRASSSKAAFLRIFNSDIANTPLEPRR